jgi:phosphoribosylformylglycinamidine synthase PurS subunit
MTQSTDMQQQVLSYVRHQAAKGPADLAALIERTAADCARCLENVSEEQAAFRYDQEWSIKEVLGHLLASTKGVNREIANLVEDRPSGSEPSMGVVSGADRPIGKLRQGLARLWRETARLAASLPEAGPERTFEHPMFGPLNPGEWIAFQRLHAMDHIQQMETIKAHPDYPRTSAMFLARVYVTLKPTVNDPQGLTIRGALHSLGFADVESVRAGKYLEVRIAADDRGKAEKQLAEMCRKLLANPVIEDYRFEVEEAARG